VDYGYNRCFGQAGPQALSLNFPPQQSLMSEGSRLYGFHNRITKWLLSTTVTGSGSVDDAVAMFNKVFEEPWS